MPPFTAGVILPNGEVAWRQCQTREEVREFHRGARRGGSTEFFYHIDGKTRHVRFKKAEPLSQGETYCLLMCFARCARARVFFEKQRAVLGAINPIFDQLAARGFVENVGGTWDITDAGVTYIARRMGL